MTAPAFVTPTAADLDLYLADPTVDTARADEIIAEVVTLCESYVDPLPAGASVVVKRVAARAYLSIVKPNGPQMGTAGSPFGQGSAGQGGPGGLVLWNSDIRDLRRLAGGSSAFDIDMLDPAYTPPSDLPYWDASWTLPGDAGSAGTP